MVYEYHGRQNQMWLLSYLDKENVNVQILSVHSQLVLEVQGGIDAEGVGVVQNTNYKNKSQIWRIEKA
jgi:hypothetical protein